ncbi:hypothetical protein C8Q76DRAFT_794269 [Earliella scabrosa]|nr:hypothetical protein C8Q76DRAFT_794269 [Earliella scabrosa]
MSVNRDAVAAATARRLASTRKAKPSQTLYMPFDEEHDLRQAFRKRIDRDILGGNSPKSAIESLKTVLQLAQNILAHPEEDKYRRFRINNERIKRTVMEPKGVLQLVNELGFRSKAEDYESYYVYSAKTHNTLRVGSSVIEEILEREVQKYEEELRRQEREAEERKAHEEKLHQHFLDDRKSVNARVQRERHEPHVKGIPARRKGGSSTNAEHVATLHV